MGTRMRKLIDQDKTEMTNEHECFFFLAKNADCLIQHEKLQASTIFEQVAKCHEVTANLSNSCTILKQGDQCHEATANLYHK